MPSDVVAEINLAHFRKRFLKYSRQAFQLLPKMDQPRILDIGCGSGVPTLELAKLSHGEIVGIDINPADLDRLNSKIEAEGLAHRITIMNCSLLTMKFPDASFDVIWAEGSIGVIGLEESLKQWRRFLKPHGFLVVHDEVKNVEERLKKIPRLGYTLMDYFYLPQGVWWNEFYAPFEKHLNRLRAKYKDNPEHLKILDQHQDEITMVKEHPDLLASIFYILQRS